MVRRLLARFILLISLIALVAAAGCSGGETETPVQILTKAGDRTVDAGSARIALRITLGADQDQLEIEGEGITDFDAESAQVTMDLGALFEAFGLPGGDGTMEARSFGSQVYIRAPILTQLLGVSTPWVGMDLDRIADEELGADLGQLNSFSNNDPRQTLAILEGSTEGAIEEIGEETIRDVDTTHYRAKVDLRRAYERSGAIVDRERFDAFLDQLGSETLDVDAWIDEDGLPRRIAYETPFPGGGEEAARLAMDLYDFGTDVDLSPPPENEVSDLLELIGR